MAVPAWHFACLRLASTCQGGESMAKRNQSAAARRTPVETPVVDEQSAPVQAPPHDELEHVFFRNGDAGIVEPPVYLPYDSILVPLGGVLLLVGLSLLVML